MSFDEASFWKKKYSKGALFFLKGFDFQKHIPARQNKRKQDFLGKTALLEFSTKEKVKIFIINADLEKNFIKIDDEKYLIDIKKFVNFYGSLKNKTNIDLAHAFFTYNVDFKNAHFSSNDFSELSKRADFQEFFRSGGSEKINSYTLTEENAVGTFVQIADSKNKEWIIQTLKSLEKNNFENFQSLIGTVKIDKILDEWESNRSNCDEKYWQTLFENNVWVLQQVFSYPVIILQGETYVGGKNTRGRNGKGGVATDFMAQDQSTNSFAVIEIKTPCKKLIGGIYRGKKGSGDTNESYSMDSGLSGGIVQLQNQLDAAINNFSNTLGKDFEEKNLNHLSPHGVLVVGTLFNLTESEKKSFFLFRKAVKDVTILAFDELFEKIGFLKKIFNDEI